MAPARVGIIEHFNICTHHFDEPVHSYSWADSTASFQFSGTWIYSDGLAATPGHASISPIDRDALWIRPCRVEQELFVTAPIDGPAHQAIEDPALRRCQTKWVPMGMVPQTAKSIDRNASDVANTADVVSNHRPILRARSPSPGGANPVGGAVVRARDNAKTVQPST